MRSRAASHLVGFGCWGTPGPRRASAALAQDCPGKLGQTLLGFLVVCRIEVLGSRPEYDSSFDCELRRCRIIVLQICRYRVVPPVD